MTLNDTENHISESTPERIRARYRALPALAENGDFGELDEDVVVIDTETTGVSFKHDELTQIAAARMSKGRITGWYTTFVNPGKSIPEDIQHLTNIHDEDVADAPSPDDALAGLVEFVGDSDLLAHNAGFDKHFCTKHPAGASLAGNLWLDSLDLARIALPRLKSHRLIDLVRAFDAPLSTHRADDDVLATCAVYRILLAAVWSMPTELLEYIAESATREEWPTVKVFQCIAGRKEKSPFGLSLKRLREENAPKRPSAIRRDADDIAADPEGELVFPTEEEMEEAFAEEGPIGKIYRHYEKRSGQVEMARNVASAFGDSVNCVIEAGTGLGKSMAYLVPAVSVAKKNGIGVGVATKTNALLDQLVNHELPLLAQQVEGLSWCSLKGFAHYPCLRMVERLVKRGPVMKRTSNDVDVHQAPALAALLSFIEQTDYDDIDALKIDYRALPRYEFCTNSYDCLRRKCPFYGDRCFVHGVRRRAERSDIVVTNQSMLFCDVAADGGLLPPIRYWVVDECHGAEDEARRAFSCKLGEDEILRIATKVSSSEASRNVFVRAERLLTGKIDVGQLDAENVLTDREKEEADAGSDGDTLLFALSSRARHAGLEFDRAAREFCLHIHDLLFFDESKRSKGYDRVELWINEGVRESYTFAALVSYGRQMYEAADRLIKACQGLIACMEDVPEAAAIQREIASTASTLKDVMAAEEIILFDSPDNYVYSANLSRKQQAPESLEARMLDMGGVMNETLYARTHSIVFTSATIAVENSFDSFEKSLGLGEGEFSETRAVQLRSGYDFDSHMCIYVASDMPEPNETAYLEELQRLLVGVHLAQRGSTLTLFTNRKDMEKCHAVVQKRLRAENLRVACQKWGSSVKGLRDDFLKDERLSLFALKSFWEGFDAPGNTLKNVVIPRLPFGKPTDPLSCERARNDSQAWSHYVLPAAVLETRQAAGRLIRSSTDRGNLVLADKRLVTKGYGKVFLRSMPSRNIKAMTIDEIISALTVECGDSDR